MSKHASPTATSSNSINSDTPSKKPKLSLIRRRFTVNYEPSICRSPRRRKESRKRRRDAAASNAPMPLWTPINDVDLTRRQPSTTTTKTKSTSSVLFNSFVAGALAGSLADLTVHPIDTINTRIKASSGKYVGGSMAYTYRVVRTEGAGSLYKGIGPTVYQALPMNAVWFMTYEVSKKFGTEHCSPGYEPLVHMGSGALGELLSAVLYVPFDVVKARMQLGDNPHATSGGIIQSKSNYQGTFQGMSTILKTEGISGLYSGFKAVILADCTMQALQFMFYEKMKLVVLKNKHQREHLRHTGAMALASNFTTVSASRDVNANDVNGDANDNDDDVSLDSKDIFFCGSVSGATAAFLTNPIDTVTARLMTQGHGAVAGGEAELKYSGVMQCAKSIVHEEGSGSLMRGWLPRTARFAVLGALTLVVYEQLRGLIGFEDDDDD